MQPEAFAIVDRNPMPVKLRNAVGSDLFHDALVEIGELQPGMCQLQTNGGDQAGTLGRE